MLGENFLTDRYTYIKYLCDEADVQEPDIIEFKNSNEACRILNYHIKNKSKIMIHGDIDVDGLATTKVLYEFLLALDSGLSVELRINKDKFHGIAAKHVEHFNNCGADLVIILDSGTNNTEYIEKIRGDVLVIDHHEITSGKLYGKTLEDSGEYYIISNMANNEESGFKADDAMSAGLVVYEFLRYFQKTYNIRDILSARQLYQWSAMSLFTDAVNNDRPRNIYYIKKTFTDQKVEDSLAMIMKSMYKNKIALDKSTVGYSIAPLFNRAIRAGESGLAMKIVCQNPQDAQVLMRFKEIQKKITDSYLEGAIEEENYVCKDITGLNIGNYSGLLATKLLNHYKKTAIVYQIKNSFAEGSFRGKSKCIDYRKNIADFGFFAEGHKPAFGFKIPLQYLKVVMEKVTSTEGSSQEYLTMGDMPENRKGIHHVETSEILEFKRAGYIWKLAAINSRLSEGINIVVSTANMEEVESGSEYVRNYRCYGMVCTAFEPITTEYADIYIEAQSENVQSECKLYIKNKLV